MSETITAYQGGGDFYEYERTICKKKQKLSGNFFLLAAFAALLFFPRVASAAAKPTAKQLKVTYRGFEYDNDTAKLYLKLSLKNTSSYTITKVKMGYEIPIMEDGTITQTFSVTINPGKTVNKTVYIGKMTQQPYKAPKVKCLSFWYKSATPKLNQLKVSYKGYEYNPNTGELYITARMQNTSSYTITKVTMYFEIPLDETATPTKTYNVNIPAGKTKNLQVQNRKDGRCSGWKGTCEM